MHSFLSVITGVLLLFCAACATPPHLVSTYWNQAAGILKEQGYAYYRPIARQTLKSKTGFGQPA